MLIILADQSTQHLEFRDDGTGCPIDLLVQGDDLYAELFWRAFAVFGQNDVYVLDLVFELLVWMADVLRQFL